MASRRDLREFLRLPFRLHANAPQWVPPVVAERRAYLSKRLNPFFKHGDAQLFLAWREHHLRGAPRPARSGTGGGTGRSGRRGRGDDQLLRPSRR